MQVLIKIKSFFSDFYNWYLTFLGALVSLAILAPITLALGLTPVSKFLYFIYSFFCHQFNTRSFYLFDYQFAWCARDTGIWFGMFIAALLIKLKIVKGIKWYWVIPFVIPIALDGGIQTLFTLLNINTDGALIGELGYISNNLTRFMTGSVFGIGISLWISKLLNNMQDDLSTHNSGVNVGNLPENQDKKENQALKRLLDKNIFRIAILIMAMFPLYVGIIGIWDLSSERNNPGVPLDALPKVNKQQFFLRRGDAICPTDASGDFLALECFFK